MKTPDPTLLTMTPPEKAEPCPCTVCSMVRRGRVWAHTALSLNDADAETKALDVASRYVSLAMMISQTTMPALPDDDDDGEHDDSTEFHPRH